jgi:hypothetical protein
MQATSTDPDPPKLRRPLACPVSNRENLLPAHLSLRARATAAPSADEQTVSGAGRPGMGTLRVAQAAGIALAPSPCERQQHEMTPYCIIRHPIVEEVFHARSHG